MTDLLARIAELAGTSIARQIAQEFGKQMHYFPCAETTTKRNAAIVAAFDGINYHALARHFNLSEWCIRQIIQDAQRQTSANGRPANQAPAPVQATTAQPSPHAPTPRIQESHPDPAGAAPACHPLGVPAAPGSSAAALVLLVPPHWKGSVRFDPCPSHPPFNSAA